MANTWVVIHRGRLYGMFNTDGKARKWADGQGLKRYQVKNVEPPAIKVYALEELDHE